MELSANAKKVFDLVKELSAVELASLVKSLEEEFGVTAASMVVAGAASSSDEGPAAGKDTFDIELTDVGQQKIAVIKVVKELLWVSLPEAKDLVEKAPCMVKKDVKNDEAETIKLKLEEAGASVSLK